MKPKLNPEALRRGLVSLLTNPGSEAIFPVFALMYLLAGIDGSRSRLYCQ